MMSCSVRRRIYRAIGLAVAGMVVVLGQPQRCPAEQLITLRNGVTLQGIYIELPTLNHNSASLGADGGIQTRPIWMIDDGLRRTYVHRRGMVNNEPVEVPDLGLRMEFPQPIPQGANEVGALGQILGVTPLNEFGRRQMSVRGTDGSPTIIYQGLTELTSRYAKLEALKSDSPMQLDMRVATESIDTPALQRIFGRLLDQDDPDARLEEVRFFIEAERYGDARRELQAILQQFPEQQELKPQLTALVERQAMQLFEQAQLRRESGQPALASAILNNFPLGRVGRVTRLRVEDELGEIRKLQTQRDDAVANLRKLVDELAPADQNALAGVVDEIDQHLSPNTLSRLSDFIRLGENETIPVQRRVALAVAGWILGSGSGEQNLVIVISWVEVRDLVAKYLAHPDPEVRAVLMENLRVLEGASAEAIAKMLPLMPPPLASDQAIAIHRGAEAAEAESEASSFHVPVGAVADELVHGMYHIGPDEEAFEAAQAADPMAVPDAAYLVQLPPEYDPLREYPCIVALHAAGAPAETQLNWWAGVATERFLSPVQDDRADPASAAVGAGDESEPGDREAQGEMASPQSKAMRLGHAARNGFIVVTPRWTRGGQQSYEYTMREHDAVLRSVRGAMRRFSIDADRIFIGGHGAGGTAAWDIALSHPDIWAGMIAIGAEPRKTLLHYDVNAVYVPTYLVMGEKDGRPLKRNGAVYDDYMTYQHDAMVVMYRGRGKEFFYEESERIYDWMKTPEHRRADFPQEIDVVTMRQGDRFFWWLEWDESLPETVINPILWEEAKRIKAAKVDARIGANNEIQISQAPAIAFTIWLSPQMPLDFRSQIAVRYRGQRGNFRFTGEFETMLEDVRSRADRKRPFWGRVKIP
ncbi:alpha/beta hydrolase [Allorhodopirellula solitaria]|uniref:Alpha/beta hydrolase family protein n=1 Tax=Allorhodopirellula solitaria TaxID=2527987 RepID=A0A5C5YCT4_9BACT|nr:alpha/beta hydrolase [Allorhodopirellula solitaria]TWT73190.1 Alpha/beta hydrolase family protein [Allorhodopirellula solitaria]